MSAKGISFSNCLALSVDNANVMAGSKNGLYGRLLEHNEKLHYLDVSVISMISLYIIDLDLAVVIGFS